MTTFTPCHTFTPGPCTTDQYLHACGTCGGDKRQPITHPRDAGTEPGGRHTHQTHLAHLPWVGHWHVYCDQGCNLGTSAVQPTFEAAVKRADLHDKATRTLGKRS